MPHRKCLMVSIEIQIKFRKTGYFFGHKHSTNWFHLPCFGRTVVICQSMLVHNSSIGNSFMYGNWVPISWTITLPTHSTVAVKRKLVLCESLCTPGQTFIDFFSANCKIHRKCKFLEFSCVGVKPDYFSTILWNIIHVSNGHSSTPKNNEVPCKFPMSTKIRQESAKCENVLFRHFIESVIIMADSMCHSEPKLFWHRTKFGSISPISHCVMVGLQWAIRVPN